MAFLPSNRPGVLLRSCAWPTHRLHIFVHPGRPDEFPGDSNEKVALPFADNFLPPGALQFQVSAMITLIFEFLATSERLGARRQPRRHAAHGDRTHGSRGQAALARAAATFGSHTRQQGARRLLVARSAGLGACRGGFRCRQDCDRDRLSYFSCRLDPRSSTQSANIGRGQARDLVRECKEAASPPLCDLNSSRLSDPAGNLRN